MRYVRKGVGIDGPIMQFVQAGHNLMLSVGSYVMFLGTLREVVLRAGRESMSPSASGAFGSVTFLFCETTGSVATGPLYFWSYVYYLSKYYELIDTVLQLCKGRAPPHFFLHVYHHATVLLMSWFWCEYCQVRAVRGESSKPLAQEHIWSQLPPPLQTLQWIGLCFNAAVHVVMYYYYFRSVLKLPTPWKRFVTQFQIIQFGFSLLCFLATLGLLLSGASCEGTKPLLFNLIFNLTLLWQFVELLRGSKAGGCGDDRGKLVSDLPMMTRQRSKNVKKVQ